MVTKEMLMRLRAERAKAHERYELTPEGAVKASVDQKIEQEREIKIAKGECYLREALNRFRQEQAFSSREGFARMQFNTRSQEAPNINQEVNSYEQ